MVGELEHILRGDSIRVAVVDGLRIALHSHDVNRRVLSTRLYSYYLCLVEFSCDAHVRCQVELEDGPLAHHGRNWLLDELVHDVVAKPVIAHRLVQLEHVEIHFHIHGALGLQVLLVAVYLHSTVFRLLLLLQFPEYKVLHVVRHGV